MYESGLLGYGRAIRWCENYRFATGWLAGRYHRIAPAKLELLLGWMKTEAGAIQRARRKLLL
ncbi:hypothetical protein GobsT_47430 [Gemmata obscuriglobus]|nr:hypothetical protein GobsT_47430 [Gemmata obscuriglobus]VTS09263.1 unnamed protein product [Gemmata obscuriglobus UQM 2246]